MNQNTRSKNRRPQTSKPAKSKATRFDENEKRIKPTDSYRRKSKYKEW